MSNPAERIDQAQPLLQFYRELVNNPAWAEIAKYLDTAADDATNGMAELGKTPEQRSEWVRAWHLVNELRTMPATRITALQKTINECSAALMG